MRLVPFFQNMRLGPSLAVFGLGWLGAIAVGSLHAILPISVGHGVAGPDFLLLATLFAGLELELPLVGMIALGILLGYLGDLFAGSPKGIHMLAYAATILCAYSTSSLLLVRGFLVTAVIAFLFALGANLLVVLIEASLEPGTTWALVACAPVGALLTALAAPLWFWLLRRLQPARGREPRLHLAQ